MEEIKRALIALQQNSLGIFQNIQYDNQLYLKGSPAIAGECAVQAVPPAVGRGGGRGAGLGGAGRVTGSDGALAQSSTKFSLLPSGRQTVSSQNLIRSDTSDSSGGSGSHASSNLSSPGPGSSEVWPGLTQQLIRTQQLPHINSSIIHTANKAGVS